MRATPRFYLLLSLLFAIIPASGITQTTTAHSLNPIPPVPTPGMFEHMHQSTPNVAHITYESAEFEGSKIKATNVSVQIGEYSLTGGRLVGDFNNELIFSDNPVLTYKGQTFHGKEIHFFPKNNAWYIDSPKTALTPQFLEGRLTSPLYIYGKDINGKSKNEIIGTDILTTTCDKKKEDYYFLSKKIDVTPGKQVILRHSEFVLWGHHLIDIPTLIIPLDKKPRKFSISHPPMVGESVDEGFFVKSSMNYLLSKNAPGLLKLDLMQKKGIGLGIEQDWKLARMIGVAALYAIPTSGFGKNVTGELHNNFNLGGGQSLQLSTDFQKQSYLALPETTAFQSRLGYILQAMHDNFSMNVSRNENSSSGFTSTSTNANLSQSYHNMGLQVDFNTDYSLNQSTSNSFSVNTQQINTKLNINQQASNYVLGLAANKTFSSGGEMGGVEKLPEVDLTNYRFLHGDLSKLPLLLNLSAGSYTEGVSLYPVVNSMTSDRVMLGADLNNLQYSLGGATDINFSEGFEQYLYSEGAAQYSLKNNITLTQRWGKYSGLHIIYAYLKSEGGTPFQFDRIGQYHTLNADVGFLDDRHVQLSLQTGYDLSQSSFGGIPSQPWQTVSGNLLLRPTPWMRLQNQATFDPNSGDFQTLNDDLDLKSNRFGEFELTTQYDPRQHVIGAMNSSFNIHIGKDWKLVGLVQYNGYLGRFESRNLQIIKDLHCLEASLTYSDNPFGFRNDQQIYFTLRIKAFPFFRTFGAGQFGQAINTSMGKFY